MELFISILFHIIYSIQLNLSMVSDPVTPWTTACQASLSIASSQCFLKLMSIKLAMPSNHLILCCPLPLLLIGIKKIETVLAESYLTLYDLMDYSPPGSFVYGVL